MNFDQPAWLILLILLPILGVGAIFTARLRRHQWSAFTAPRLRTSLLRRSSPLPRWFALCLLLTACAALIVALARPQGDAGTRTEKTLGRNVLIALDLSRSMRVADVKPDRLSQAKMVIYELLEAMPNERIGLIGFAGNSYLYAPLTVDHAAVQETVEQIDETWPTLGGSYLTGALRLGVDTLKKTGQKNNALVILSDGEETTESSLNAMIAEAKQSGVYILTIGVGTENGDYVPNKDFENNRMVDRDGKPIISRLQTDVLRKLAEGTHGRFAIAGSGANIPIMVKSAIKDLDAFELEGRERRVIIEFYQWLVLPAIIMLMASILIGTRWRSVNAAATVSLFAFFTATPSRADEVSSAKEALHQNRNAEAQIAYHHLAEETHFGNRRASFRLGEATAAYRAGDFKQARTAYSRAMLSEDQSVQESARIGMGNTLFQMGWQNLAGTPYPAASAETPNLEKFDELVRNLLATLQQNEAELSGPSAEEKQIQSIITDWVDAVSQFDSKFTNPTTAEAAKQNRSMTITYLKRLRDLMKEEKEQTEQSMPPPQQQQQDSPQPQEGGDDPKEPKKDGKDKPKPDGEPGKQGEPKDKEQPSNPNQDQQPKPKDPKDQDQKDSPKEAKRPDETPEEQAQRILKENSDLEKGLISPGRREFRAAEKDW